MSFRNLSFRFSFCLDNAIYILYIYTYLRYICVHMCVCVCSCVCNIWRGGEGLRFSLNTVWSHHLVFFPSDLFESKISSLLLQIQIDWHELILPPILGMPVFAFLISMSTFTHWELEYGFALDRASIYHVCILCSCTWIFSFCHIYIYYLVLFNGREGHVISKINIWYILYIIYYMGE